MPRPRGLMERGDDEEANQRLDPIAQWWHQKLQKWTVTVPHHKREHPRVTRSCTPMGGNRCWTVTTIGILS